MDATRYSPAPATLVRRSLDRVLVRLPAAPLHTLPGTAAEVWGLLDRAPTVDEIVAHLTGRYDGDAGGIRTDVEALLGTLVAGGLVVATPSARTPVA